MNIHHVSNENHSNYTVSIPTLENKNITYSNEVVSSFFSQGENNPCMKYCLDFYKSKYEVTYYIKHNKYKDMNENKYLYYKTICQNICQMFEK